MDRKGWFLLGAIAAIVIVVALIIRFATDDGEPDVPAGSPQDIGTAHSDDPDQEGAGGADAGDSAWNEHSAPFSDLPEDEQALITDSATEFAQAWLSSSYEDDVDEEYRQTAASFATDDFSQSLQTEDSDSQWEDKLAERQAVTTADVVEARAVEYVPDDETVKMYVHVETRTEANDDAFAGTTNVHTSVFFDKTGDGWKVSDAEIFTLPPDGTGD